MPYNPNIHHRRSIRLKGYDYSQAGLYFVTICTQNRECLFGEIRRDEPSCLAEMILNDAGNMIAKWYNELENKFLDIRCHEMIIMPNHFHFIVQNVGPVGADLRVCPNDLTEMDKSEMDKSEMDKSETNKSETNKSEMDKSKTNNSETNNSETNLLGEHIGSPLHCVVQWFKTMSTNEYIRGVKTLNWKPFNGKLWQRNYWEHIIRDEQEYQRIAEYIIINPQQWDNDKLK